MDGRDIASNVLPDAEYKFYITASPEVRAKRLLLELQAQNRTLTFEEVLQDIKERDYRDSHRKTAPLRRADDAVLLDTSELSLQESVDAILNLIRKKTGL